MKKLSLLLIAMMCVSFGYAQDGGMKFITNSFKEQKGNLSGESMLARFIENWPVDDNDEETALVRVKVENFPLEEAKKLVFTVTGNSTASVARIDDTHLIQQSTFWVFISHGSNLQLIATHQTTGVSYGKALFSFPGQLEPKHVYDLTLSLDKTTTINVQSKPAGAQVYLDGESIGKTPATRQAVPFGEHNLKLVLGTQSREETIIVTDELNVFNNFDLRQRHRVSFSSDPSGALLSIYEGNTLVIEKPTPCEIELPEGDYRGLCAAIGSEKKDEHTFSVTANTASHSQRFFPIIKKLVQFSGTEKKLGNAVPTTIKIMSTATNESVIDQATEQKAEENHKIQLPYGEYKVRLSHAGNTYEETVKVNAKSKDVYTWKLKEFHRTYTVWEKYEPAPFSVSLGYVQKQMVYKGNGSVAKDAGVWGFGDKKKLHGMEFGFAWHPAMKWGGGIYTGMFFDGFYSVDNDFYKNTSTDYDRYFEVDVYVPLHLMYRLPLGEKVALLLHGGVGVTYAVHAELGKSSDDSVEPNTKIFGKERFYFTDDSSKKIMFPEAYNVTGELAVGLRINKIMIEGTYSRGLIDHGCMKGFGDSSKQNRLSLGVSYVLGGE